MKTCSAPGSASRIWRAPWTSISSTTGSPGGGAALELAAQRPVAAAGVLGVLDERALAQQRIELPRR